MDIIWPSSFPELITGRLLLRQVSEKDAHDLFTCYSSSETMRYLGTPLNEPESIEGILGEYIHCRENGTGIVWALETREDGSFAGTAGFEEWSFLDARTEISFTLKAEHQGKGLMREALSAIISYGFDTLNINRMEALIHPENRRAVKLILHLGFRLEGRLEKRVYFQGGFHDQLMFARLRSGG